MVTTLDRPTAPTAADTQARGGSRDTRPYPVPAEEAFRDPTWQPPTQEDEEDEPEEWPLLEYVAADDLARIGLRLIQANESLAHLRTLRVQYRWKLEGRETKGKATLGRCQKPGGLLKHFADCDFVIWLAADHCRNLLATYKQVEALVFHELCHMSVSEKGAPTVVAHDFEGFGAEVRIYGEYLPDLRLAGQVFRQLPLDLE